MTELNDIFEHNKFSLEEILEMEKEYLVPAVGHYYKEPRLMVRGKGATLYDNQGREYTDLFAGVCTIHSGHCHPTMTAALKKQLDHLMHTTTLYPTLPMALYARKLASISPEGLDSSFFVNSGSEANEAALHLAKKYTNCNYVLSLMESFHGRTLMAMSMTNLGTWRQNMTYASGTVGTPNCNCYRCPFGKDPDTCDVECARFAETVIRTQTPKRIAAIIAEPMQGVGGITEPVPDFFPILYDIVKKYDGLFISDEVQTGFGRTGKHMWGIENWGIVPDMMTMAKGMASGFGIGGFITRKEISECLAPKDLFSTFGGNPLAMTAGLANLEIIEKEDLMGGAITKGARFEKNLRTFLDEHPLIGDIRGKGLMLGMELVTDRVKKTPAADEARLFMEKAKDRGVLVGLGGLNANVIRIQPPMVLTMEQIDASLVVMDAVLSEIESGM